MIQDIQYGKSFELWRNSCAKSWKRYTCHEFVEGLEKGTLPRSSFLNYLRQDYIFLQHFSRAWALAIVKSSNMYEMRKIASVVNALVNEEIKLHIKVCEREGISERELLSTIEESANIAYTRYVLEVGYSGTFADLMAVLAPCVMGYGEIGFRLGNSAHGSTYSEWIQTYSATSYQELCCEVGEMIDESIIARYGRDAFTLPIWYELCKKFEIATKLEICFWDMGLKS